jgi:hypothetical protein
MPENPSQDLARFRYLTLRELNQYAQRAERSMNRGLEQHRWNVVRAHRNTMLAVDAERQRRNKAVETAASEAAPGKAR